jgi:hypothetical protein
MGEFYVESGLAGGGEEVGCLAPDFVAEGTVRV